jgi:predicted transcriptional regulator
MAKRNKLEIMKDILAIIQKNNNNIKPTPLSRKSNLSSTRFKEYFLELTQKGFIKEINRENSNFISLTEKGFRFLERYKTIVNFIDEFEL